MKPATQLRYAMAVLLAFAVGLCSSCTRDLPRSRFVAAYGIEHENGIESLTLNSDGSYRHDFKRTDGNEVNSSGSWEVVKVGRKQRILVHNFTPYFPSRPHVAANWTLEPYETFGYLRLYVSREPRQFYIELPQ